MQLKLIIALVEDERTDRVLEAARADGATGATVITGGRGEGLQPATTFFGLDLTARRDIVLVLVTAARARVILETIRDAGRFETEPGAGIAFQVDIEDAVGLNTQLSTLMDALEKTP